MSFRWIVIISLLLLASVAIAGCGGGSPAPAPDKDQAGKKAPSGDTATAGDSGAEGFDKFGKKDIIASARFGDYLHQNFGGSGSPWWYSSIADFPEVRVGSRGTVGVVTVHIIPSEKSKTDEILGHVAAAALGCADPKMDAVVLVDRQGKTLLEKKK